MYVVLPPGAALEVQIKLSVISVFIFADKKISAISVLTRARTRAVSHEPHLCDQCVKMSVHNGHPVMHTIFMWYTLTKLLTTNMYQFHMHLDQI